MCAENMLPWYAVRPAILFVGTYVATFVVSRWFGFVAAVLFAVTSVTHAIWADILNRISPVGYLCLRTGHTDPLDRVSRCGQGLVVVARLRGFAVLVAAFCATRTWLRCVSSALPQSSGLARMSAPGCRDFLMLGIGVPWLGIVNIFIINDWIDYSFSPAALSYVQPLRLRPGEMGDGDCAPPAHRAPSPPAPGRRAHPRHLRRPAAPLGRSGVLHHHPPSSCILTLFSVATP